MLMTYSKISRVDHIKFINRFKESEVDKIGEELDGILMRGNSRLLIDLSESTSIDEKALAMLTRLSQKAVRRKGQMVLFRPSRKLVTLLRMTQLTATFEMSFSFHNALNVLNRN